MSANVEPTVRASETRLGEVASETPGCDDATAMDTWGSFHSGAGRTSDRLEECDQSVPIVAVECAEAFARRTRLTVVP